MINHKHFQQQPKKDLTILTGKPGSKEVVPNMSTDELIQRTSSIMSSIIAVDPAAITYGMQTYKYAEIALHPAASPAINFKHLSPFKNGSHFRENNNYDKFPEYKDIDQKVIDMIEYQIERMEHETFENSLKSIWWDSFIYGYPVAEKNFKWFGDMYVMSSIKPHAPHRFDFETNKYNELAKIRYRDTGAEIIGTDLHKMIVAPYPYVKHGNYYGVSSMQSIYMDIKVIEVLEKAQSEGVRRLSVKPIIHWYIAQNLEKAELEKVTQQLYAIDGGSVVDLPAGASDDGKMVKWHEIQVLENLADPDGVVLIKDILDVLYKRVNRHLDMPDDLGYSSSETGSYAKSKQETELKTVTTEGDKKFITDFVNRQIVPDLMKYNFPSLMMEPTYNLPLFVLGKAEARDNFLDLEYWGGLVDRGIMKASGEDLIYMREQMNLPPPPEDQIEPEVVDVESEPVEPKQIGPKPEEQASKKDVEQLTSLLRRSFIG